MKLFDASRQRDHPSLNEIQKRKSVRYTLGSLSLNDDVVNVIFEVLDTAEIIYLSPMLRMDRCKFFSVGMLAVVKSLISPHVSPIRHAL